MIIDSLENVTDYNITERLEQAFVYLEENDFKELEDSKYEVDGEEIFAIVDSYQPKAKEDGFWEGHRQYIDIQYLVEGTELIGYSNLERMNFQKYDADKDLAVFEGEGDFLTLEAGDFMLLRPQDIHMPGIAVNDDTQRVKKVIVKIKVD
ncbi:YhcH/YjgK/YiaL family protein [Natroniella sulfidigena]|uniref:YhcH/YjgK/YiaL family protein n=1 Tax=Natroniella sulfidigena TaxID=723921 RepID=UPI00200A2840|nr:YhcH/YjgK/YiaL family protein [Natroniella sulfidigena]MCK8816726.1 YhcH/YjgK/YiaL family protein [Natroniella sulfidigena]